MKNSNLIDAIPVGMIINAMARSAGVNLTGLISSTDTLGSYKEQFKMAKMGASYLGHKILNKADKLKSSKNKTAQEQAEASRLKEARRQSRMQNIGRTTPGMPLATGGETGAMLTNKSNLRKFFKKGTAKTVIPSKSIASKFGPTGFLRWSWWTLIPSFGISTLYFPIHAIGHVVMPNTFCRFGDEWFGLSSAPGTGKFINWIETGAATILITIQIIIFLGLLMFTIFIVDIIENSWIFKVILFLK